MSTPYLRSVSGSNQPFKPVDNQPTPGLTAGGIDHGTPASTTKHAKVEVDDCDSSETSDTEDDHECGSDGELSTDCREAEINGAPNSSTPSMKIRWTIPGSELYSIQPIRTKELFEDNGDFSEILKREIVNGFLRQGSRERGRIGMLSPFASSTPVVIMETTTQIFTV